MKSKKARIILEFDKHIANKLTMMAEDAHRKRKNFLENLILSYVLTEELKKN